MYRLAKKHGFILVMVLLLLNQGLRHFRSHTQTLLKFHMQIQGVEEKKSGETILLSHGESAMEADIIIPDLFDEMYTWSLMIDDLPNDQHWILMSLPIFTTEDEEINEVKILGDEIVKAWKEHEHGVNRVIAHGSSAILAVEAVNEHPEYIQELVLINPILPGYFPDSEALVPQSNERMRERLNDFSGLEVAYLPDAILEPWVDHFQQGFYGDLVSSLRTHKLSKQIKGISVKVIWSNPNPFCSDELRQHVKTFFPNADWTELAGCGFAPHYRCSEQLAALLSE